VGVGIREDNNSPHTKSGDGLKLLPEQIAQVRARGLYVTECCDACRAVLNQSHRWTIQGVNRVFCSEDERDRVYESLKRHGELKVGLIAPRRASRMAQDEARPDLATRVRLSAPTRRSGSKHHIGGVS